MITDPILIERNWCEVAGDIGLMLPNFTVRDMPERFVDWCHQVRIVAEISRRDLVGTFADKERDRANSLARADVMEDV